MTHITDEGGKLVELAKRCEEAAADKQGDLLDLAYRVLHAWPDKNYDFSAFNRFQAMLKAGAYESAAMMLVPQGARVRLERHEDDRAAAWVWFPAGDYPPADWANKRATSALAICAAALRADADRGEP